MESLRSSMIPEIFFVRSRVYDKSLKRAEEFEIPPKEEFMDSKVRSYKEAWDERGEEILEAISEALKIPWVEAQIPVYVTWGVRPFSSPLTINVKADPVETRDCITHELIHRILNRKDKLPKQHLDNLWNFVEKYREKEYGHQVLSHIIVHAVHEYVLRKLGWEDRVQYEIEHSQEYPDYKLSWDIVQKEGYMNIINELTQGL